MQDLFEGQPPPETWLALSEGEPERECSPPPISASLLEALPDDALLSILTCGALAAVDLGNLQRASPRFWRRISAVGAVVKGGHPAVSICAAAAGQLLAARPDGAPVQPRDDEDLVFTLEALERRLRPPLPVAVGDYHTVALARGGCVFSFGRGEQGQLGHGDTTEWKPLAELWNIEELSPKEILRSTKRELGPASCVAAGASHSAAVAAGGGSLCTWGSNALGHGGRCWGSANALSAPRLVLSGLPLPSSGERVVSVAAGDAYMACITSTGAVYSWGGESRGRLGHGHGGMGLSGPGGVSQQLVPRRVRGALSSRRVVSVSCGCVLH